MSDKFTGKAAGIPLFMSAVPSAVGFAQPETRRMCVGVFGSKSVPRLHLAPSYPALIE